MQHCFYLFTRFLSRQYSNFLLKTVKITVFAHCKGRTKKLNTNARKKSTWALTLKNPGYLVSYPHGWQACQGKVWKSGGASSNVVGDGHNLLILVEISANRSAKIWGCHGTSVPQGATSLKSTHNWMFVRKKNIYDSNESYHAYKFLFAF